MGISAAFAAVYAGTATVAMVATVVSVVGAGISVVGMLTGNKAMIKWGGILSLAGGVVGIAAGAIGGGAAAGAEIGAIDASMAGTAVETGAGLTGAEMVGSTPNLAEFGATEGIVDGAASSASSSFTPPNITGTPETGLLGSSSAPSTEIVPQQPAAPGNEAAQATGSSVGNTAKVNLPPKGGIGQWWSDLPKDVQAKYVTQMVQTGGNAIGGLFQGWSEEQKMEFQQNQEQFRQQMETNRSAQPTFKAPKPVGGLLNTTAKAA